MRDLFSWLQPEVRFFVTAARRSAAAEELARLVEPGFRWPVIEALVRRELAAIWLFRALRLLPAGVVPADVARRLAAVAMMFEFRMRCLENGLRQAVGILADARVDVVLLKGAALSVTAYASFTQRGMQDLDLLVRPGDYERADAALRAAGWTPTLADTTQPFYERHQHGVPLVAPALGGPRLELHTRLFHGDGPFGLAAADIFADAVPVTVDGRPALVPSAPHTLLYLCLHYAWSHGMTRGLLRALQDLEALWGTTGGVDAAFAPLARETRAATCCYWTLRFARSLFGLPVDAALLRALRPPRPEWALALLERHYAGVAGLAPAVCPSVWLERALWTFGVMPAWSGHGDERPWTAGDDWAAVAPEWVAATDGGRPRRWGAAVGRLGRYATALLRP
jgi:hypothetical protein